jgi:negative regulator of sigma-B (phosphoserine phosphatase)
MEAMTPTAEASPLALWGVAARALGDGPISGDLHVVAPFAGGLLAAVIDGLGHGPEAQAVATLAAHVLLSHREEAPAELLQRCHGDLRRTRGVVLSLASFNAENSSMTWLGVGNVEGFLFRADNAANPARERLLLRGGVVGYQIPPLRAAVLPVAPGDLLLLATDGIRHDFADRAPPRDAEPQYVADDILERCTRVTDDALILALRYQGSPRE